MGGRTWGKLARGKEEKRAILSSVQLAANMKSIQVVARRGDPKEYRLDKGKLKPGKRGIKKGNRSSPARKREIAL